jgi:uncharacterized glyoxalase superfamily metalloenzyme YdcJ
MPGSGVVWLQRQRSFQAVAPPVGLIHYGGQQQPGVHSARVAAQYFGEQALRPAALAGLQCLSSKGDQVGVVGGF